MAQATTLDISPTLSRVTCLLQLIQILPVLSGQRDRPPLGSLVVGFPGLEPGLSELLSARAPYPKVKCTQGTASLCMKRQSSKVAAQDSILSSPAPEDMLGYLSHNRHVIGSDPYLWPYTLHRGLACKSAPGVSYCLSGFLHSVSSLLTPVLKLLCMSCTQLTLGQEDSPGGPNLIPGAPLKAQGESERSAP